MKPKETSVRSFKLYPTIDQAAKYTCLSNLNFVFSSTCGCLCASQMRIWLNVGLTNTCSCMNAAILKDSDFNEVERAECQFSTMATILDNGSQITPFQPPKTSINGVFESIESTGKKFWEGLMDFVTWKNTQEEMLQFLWLQLLNEYMCLSWILMFGLVLALFPTVLVLLWLSHQKGLFDPLFDWWEDHFQMENQRTRDIQRERIDVDHPHIHTRKHHRREGRHHKHDACSTEAKCYSH